MKTRKGHCPESPRALPNKLLGHNSITRGGAGVFELDKLYRRLSLPVCNRPTLSNVFRTLPQAKYLFHFLKKNPVYKVDLVLISIIFY